MLLILYISNENIQKLCGRIFPKIWEGRYWGSYSVEYSLDNKKFHIQIHKIPHPRIFLWISICSTKKNPPSAFSALTLLVGRHEAHPACKKLSWWCAGVVSCLVQGADLHMVQLMPLPLTVSCFSKIQIGFTFLVLAHPLNMCVCSICSTSCIL